MTEVVTIIKYHINNEGQVAQCRARSGPCPFGKEMHFSTREEAENYKEVLYKSRYGPLAEDRTKRFKAVMNDPESIASKVFATENKEKRGFQYECFAASTIAEEMGLEQVVVLNDKGVLQISGDADMSEQFDAIAKATNGLKEYYEGQGEVIDNSAALARVVYFSKDSDKMLVQSGGPNVLDAAVIEANNVVDLIEIKKLHDTGAQMSSLVLETDAAGAIADESYENMKPHMIVALRGLGYKRLNGTNYILKITPDQSLEFFIEGYKAKGAKTFVYTTNQGRLMTEDFTQPTDVIMKRLKEKGVRAEVKVRTNYSPQVMKQKDIDRLDFYTGAKYFEGNHVPFTNSFKLGDLKEDLLTTSSGYARFGEFILPVKLKDFKKLGPDYEVNKSDLRYFPVTLTGDVKLNF